MGKSPFLVTKRWELNSESCQVAAGDPGRRTAMLLLALAEGPTLGVGSRIPEVQFDVYIYICVYMCIYLFIV